MTEDHEQELRRILFGNWRRAEGEASMAKAWGGFAAIFGGIAAHQKWDSLFYTLVMCITVYVYATWGVEKREEAARLAYENYPYQIDDN